MAKNTTNTTDAREDLETIIRALVPAKVCREEGLSVPKRSEVIAARRAVVHLWADADAGRPCVAASFTIGMSDGSSLPFRLWAEGILAIREGGKAHAESVL